MSDELVRAIKSLIDYAKDLDCTERPAIGEYDVTADIRRVCQFAADALSPADDLTDALVRVIDGWRRTHPDLSYFETVTVIEGIGRTLHNLRADAERIPEATEAPHE